MRIGINALALVPTMHGGVRTYITNLIANLQLVDDRNEYWVFTNKYSSDDFQFTAPNFHEVRVQFEAEHRLKRILVEQVILPLYARNFRLSVLHSPNQSATLLLPCASILTVLDLHFLYPELTQHWRSGQLVYYRAFIPPSVRRANKIIAISEFSAQDIASKLRVARERIAVIHLAANQELFRSGLDPIRAAEVREKHGLQAPFILCVGGYGPHKNVAAAIEAVNLLRKTNRLDIRLIILGMVRGNAGLPQELLECPERYYFASQVPVADLPYFYHFATALVFPSLFEGFGLPVVEAFACGCPVICSRRCSLPEVAGDAAWLVDPLQPEEIAEAVYRLTTDQDLRSRFIANGFSRAHDFSWKTVACRTIEAYEDGALDYYTAKDHARSWGPL